MTGQVLEIDQISRRFGALPALDRVSFTAHPGELFGLLGDRAAGKTTTLRITAGAQLPDTGTVRFSGRPAAGARFGYLPAEGGLHPAMRALDQLVHLARLHGLSTNDAHRAGELWLARLGLAPLRTTRIRKLDADSAHRLRLAAALVHRPDVLLLDEPHPGIDQALLREQAAAGVPVVLASRQFDLVERLCDRIGVLRAGWLVASGTIAELTAHVPRRLSVTAPHARPGWNRTVPGTKVLSENGGTTLLELSPHADDQAVLAAALATGPVTEFRRHRRSPAELFPDEAR